MKFCICVFITFIGTNFITDTTAQSITDLTLQLENMLGPGAVIREVIKDGRNCVCGRPGPNQSSTREQTSSTTETTITQKPTTPQKPATPKKPTANKEPSTTVIDEMTTPMGLRGFHSYACDDMIIPFAADKNGDTHYTFASPRYPDLYPQGICCTWKMLYPEAWLAAGLTRVVIYTFSGDSFLSENCNSDFLTVHNINYKMDLAQKEEKCGNFGGQLGIVKHSEDERGVVFRLCRNDDSDVNYELSTGKVAIIFRVMAF